MERTTVSNQNPTEESCIGLRTTVCRNGVVNVKRPESDRAHSVFVDESGDVARCSCKGYYYRGHCSHADAIEQRPLVVSSALAASASYNRVATDGGQRVETGGDDETCRHGNDCPGVPAESPSCTDGCCDDCQTDYYEREYGDNSDDPETCDRCPTRLADVRDRRMGEDGYTVVTTDGEELCPDCADARCGAEIGFGQCERNDCPYCDDESDDEAGECEAPSTKEWCNGPDHADNPERETCILCECYADPDVSNPGDESRPDETDTEPTRTERADFGGGESTGVEEL